jgi:sugar lactone lactonase YvrE
MKTLKTALISLLLMSGTVVACSEDAGSGGEAVGGGGAEVGGSSEGGQPEGAASAGGASQGGGGAAATVEVVAVLDAAAFELPEGLAVRGDDTYVGFAFTGAVEALDLATGARSPFGAAPPPPPNTSFMTGLTTDDQGRVYAAYVSFTADAVPGVYRAEPGGGELELFSTHPQLVFPNGFAWGDDGSLYVTDSAVGGVFKIDPSGAAELWLSDPLLAGSLEACGPHGDIAVGANGVVFKDGALTIASSDQALVARVPISRAGEPGPLAIVAGPDCAELAGIDGLTWDDDGQLLAAINRANKVVSIDAAGGVTTIAEGAPLDFPASLELAGDGDDRALVVTSFALAAFLSGGDPQPAIVRIVR